MAAFLEAVGLSEFLAAYATHIRVYRLLGGLQRFGDVHEIGDGTLDVLDGPRKQHLVAIKLEINPCQLVLLLNLGEDRLVGEEMFVGSGADSEHVVEIFCESFPDLIFDPFPGRPGGNEIDLLVNEINDHFAAIGVLKVHNGRKCKLIEDDLFIIFIQLYFLWFQPINVQPVEIIDHVLLIASKNYVF